MRTMPLTAGEKLPALELSHEDGRGADLETLLTENPLAIYFMRTPTCPVCHAHLRHMERATLEHGTLADRVLVVVPGDPGDAAAVSRRHPGFAGRVTSSQSAHAAVGLFTRAGLQQSGTVVVDAARTVLSSRASTIPIGSFSEDEVRSALGPATV